MIVIIIIVKNDSEEDTDVFTISDFINRQQERSRRICRYPHGDVPIRRTTIIRIFDPLESHQQSFKLTGGGNTKSSIFDLH